jgi:hypothetical protein
MTGLETMVHKEKVKFIIAIAASKFKRLHPKPIMKGKSNNIKVQGGQV